MRKDLTPGQATKLLGNTLGLGYSWVIVGRGATKIVKICLLHWFDFFNCSEQEVARADYYWQALCKAFEPIRKANWPDDPMWLPENWRKGVYVGPPC